MTKLPRARRGLLINDRVRVIPLSKTVFDEKHLQGCDNKR